MTSLKEMLERLDLSQYLDAFVNEGFDSWEILMDITESDLEVLGVKLGHRRKLQRAILNSSRDNVSIASLSQAGASVEDGSRNEDKKPKGQQEASSSAGANNSNAAPRGKRKYRRHPKPDEYAPERPPSAYVIFSNQMRDKLKGQELSFAEIAKLVGERWQELNLQEKEPCEKEAQALKDKYYSELGEYKKTSQYTQYQSYLTDFKAKHGDRDSKKQKLPVNSPRTNVQARAPSIDSNMSSNEASVTATSPNYSQRPQPDSPNQSEHSPAYHSPKLENFRRFPPRPPSEDGNPLHQHLPRIPMSLYRGYQPKNHPEKGPSPFALNYSLNPHPAPSFSASLPSLTRMDTTSSQQSSEPVSRSNNHSQITLPPLDDSLKQTSDMKAKTSLATLLRATEHVDRDTDRSHASSPSSRTPQNRTPQSQNPDKDRS